MHVFTQISMFFTQVFIVCVLFIFIHYINVSYMLYMSVANRFLTIRLYQIVSIMSHLFFLTILGTNSVSSAGVPLSDSKQYCAVMHSSVFQSIKQLNIAVLYYEDWFVYFDLLFKVLLFWIQLYHYSPMSSVQFLSSCKKGDFVFVRLPTM